MKTTKSKLKKKQWMMQKEKDNDNNNKCFMYFVPSILPQGWKIQLTWEPKKCEEQKMRLTNVDEKEGKEEER